MSSPPDLPELKAMLAEALAQYRALPGEFLEGVVVGMTGMRDIDADRSWCDMLAKPRQTSGLDMSGGDNTGRNKPVLLHLTAGTPTLWLSDSPEWMVAAISDGSSLQP